MLPEGVTLHENFVTEEEARDLEAFCRDDSNYDEMQAEKQDYAQAYFGLTSTTRRPFIYRSDRFIPPVLWKFCERIHALEEFGPYYPNMIMINRYRAGKGVPMHQDLRIKGFLAAVLTVCGKETAMSFDTLRHQLEIDPDHPEHFLVPVRPRGLMVLNGTGLSCYEHAIDDHTPEAGEVPRISIQFRVANMKYFKADGGGDWPVPVEFMRGFLSDEKIEERLKMAEQREE